MAFIELGIIRIDRKGDKVRIVCPAAVNPPEGERYSIEMWYEVDSQYEKYLYTDRADSFVVAILPYCMKNLVDIKVDKNIGISSDLLFRLKEILIPTMAKAEKFDCIEIEAWPVWEKISPGREIATGISRGVDSFYTLLKTMEGDYQPTYLALFNTQAYGEFGGSASEEMFYQDLGTAEHLCGEINHSYGTEMKLLSVCSNIQEELPIEIYYAGSFRDAAAVILLKRMITLYFFSTTVSLDSFTLHGSCRELEPWLFFCLSDDIQRIQPIGTDKSRLEKVKYISKYPITYNYLQVCRKPLYCGTEGRTYNGYANCTYSCEKCRCTVLELMAVGKLKNYQAVFNMDWIEKNRQELLGEVISRQKQRGELDYSEIYKTMRENGTIDDFLEIKAGLQLDTIDDAPKDRDYRILELMNLFISRKQRGISFKENIREMGYQNVGIYGMGRLGKLLYHELGETLKLEIDRKRGTQYGAVEMRHPDEDLSELDLIIITTVYKEKAIKAYLKSRTTCEIITFKEFIALPETSQRGDCNETFN